MSDEDLELLITLDDPRYAPDEDTFNHLQPFPITGRADDEAKSRLRPAYDSDIIPARRLHLRE